MIRSNNAPKKENEDFNYKLFATFNVDNILSNIKSFNNEWLIYTERQDALYNERRNPHLYTNTYIIQDHPLTWKFGSKINSIIKDHHLINTMSEIIKTLEEDVVGKVARVLLVKLSAGKDVTEHVDSGDYLSTVRRYHIPIITNDSVFYTVNSETINMKKGECWEINNLKPHSVLNNSNEDRIHLLIDILPEYSFRSTENFDKKYDLRIVDNFISDEDADFFIEYIIKNHHNENKFPPTRGAIEFGRHRYEANIPETVPLKNHEEIVDKIKFYSNKVLQEFRDLYNETELYTSAFWLAELGKDTKLPFHSDNHYMSEHLYRSCVIYLNEDYEGGYIRFKDIPLTYKPKKFSAIFFKADMVHEITKIKNGIRFALPVWASIDKKWDIFSNDQIKSNKNFFNDIREAKKRFLSNE
jgi:hypothetical protein